MNRKGILYPTTGLNPGDKIDIEGVTAKVVASNPETVTIELPKAGNVRLVESDIEKRYQVWRKELIACLKKMGIDYRPKRSECWHWFVMDIQPSEAADNYVEFLE